MPTQDVHTVAERLKQERLDVEFEKQLIQWLNGNVLKATENLYCVAWVARQQRINLDLLNSTR